VNKVDARNASEHLSKWSYTSGLGELSSVFLLSS